MDFALWKAGKPGEPVWESPWGPGRPGWHIECSAMSRKYLGDTFDFHGGGKDLVFPHHENELAQSVGASGKPFARYWLHHGFVTIKDEKMSKSLGNFLTIREVLEKFSAEALRLFVFSSHYRSPLDYSEDALADAEAGVERLYQCLLAARRVKDAGGGGIGEKDRAGLARVEERFNAAMDNDFNSAKALAAIFDAARTVNRVIQKNRGELSGDAAGIVREAAAVMTRLAGIMGLRTKEPEAFFREKREKMLAGIDLGAEEIENLIKERNTARAARDWKRSDAIRDRLMEHGIILKDGPEGTTWTVNSGDRRQETGDRRK
jgi:cysteinyl-tRNA synthetase